MESKHTTDVVVCSTMENEMGRWGDEMEHDKRFVNNPTYLSSCKSVKESKACATALNTSE